MTAVDRFGSLRLLVYALVPMAVAFLTHAGALRHGFIWDDPLVFEQLRAFRGLGDVLALPDAVPKFYYRPLIFATLLLDRTLGGEAPFWFHASVLAWHAAATGLVFVLGRALLGPERAIEAGAAALLFAVHPGHVESVAWIAGRSDVVAAVLLIAAVLVARRTASRATAWVAGALFLLALLAKEVAVAALALVPLRDALEERRLYWRRYVPLALALGVYVFLRRRALGAAVGGLPVAAGAAALARDVVAAVGWYAATLLVPVNLNAYVPAVPAGAAYAIGGLLCVGLGVATALWCWRKGEVVPVFLVAWVGLTMLPSLGVIVRRSASAPVAERYLYVPSVGAVLLLAWGLTRVRPPARRYAVGALVLLAVAGGVRSVQRTRVWADDLVFWTDVAAKSPGDALPHRELGNAYLRRNQLDAAERAFATALAAGADREGMVMTYNNLGNVRLRRGDLDAADAAFTTGLDLYPHPFLYNGRARVAIRRAELAQARGDGAEALRQVRAAGEALTRALAADPRDYRNHVLLGQVLFNLGERAAARRHLEMALEIEPRGAVADTARQFLRQLGP
jgi:hypothetical protein